MARGRLMWSRGALVKARQLLVPSASGLRSGPLRSLRDPRRVPVSPNRCSPFSGVGPPDHPGEIRASSRGTDDPGRPEQAVARRLAQLRGPTSDQRRMPLRPDALQVGAGRSGGSGCWRGASGTGACSRQAYGDSLPSGTRTPVPAAGPGLTAGPAARAARMAAVAVCEPDRATADTTHPATPGDIPWGRR